MGKVYTNKQGQKAIRYTAKDKAKQQTRMELKAGNYQLWKTDTQNLSKRLNAYFRNWADVNYRLRPTLADIETEITRLETYLAKEYQTDKTLGRELLSDARLAVLATLPAILERGELKHWDKDTLAYWRARLTHFDAELRFYRAVRYAVLNNSHPCAYVIQK